MNSPYPTAEHIMRGGGAPAPAPAAVPGGAPEQKGEAPGAASDAMAKVIEAVQILAAFIASLEEKGNPKAVEAKAGLMKLIQAISGQPGAENPQVPAANEAPNMSPHPMASPTAGGARPMNAPGGGAPQGARVL